MTNKISSASQTVRAFNVGTQGDCSAWDDNLDAAPLEWLPAEEAPSFMSGTGSDEVCESGIGFAREREGCCMCSFGFDAVGVRNGDSELLESMRDRNVRHASSEIDVGKSSVGMMSWIPTSKVLGSKRHRPAVFESRCLFRRSLYRRRIFLEPPLGEFCGVAA